MYTYVYICIHLNTQDVGLCIYVYMYMYTYIYIYVNTLFNEIEELRSGVQAVLRRTPDALYLSLSLSLSPYIYISLSLSLLLSLSPSIYISLSLALALSLSIYLHISLSVSLSPVFFLLAFFFSISPPSLCLSHPLSMSLSFSRILSPLPLPDLKPQTTNRVIQGARPSAAGVYAVPLASSLSFSLALRLSLSLNHNTPRKTVALRGCGAECGRGIHALSLTFFLFQVSLTLPEP